MKPSSHRFLAAACFCICLSNRPALAQPAALGEFAGQGDIGVVQKPGSLEYNEATKTYLIAGGGENMWFTNDAMHYIWKRMSGDLTLAADIRWPVAGGNAHRKACLIIRQTLEPESAYADVAVHGEGLTSLQYRENAGETTHEIQSAVTLPTRVRLEKHGEYVSMSLATPGEKLHPAGGSFRIQFKEPFYVGLAVCAHDNKTIEKAAFSKVEIQPVPANSTAPRAVASTLEIIPIGSKDRRAIYFTTDRIEAPNWSHDGQSLLYNRQGRLYKMPVAGGQPELVDTGFAVHCTHDHGISPDGAQLAITDETEPGKFYVYTLPVIGGTPHRVTKESPSHWRDWSPDGHTLLFSGARNGQTAPLGVYAIATDGADERTLNLTSGNNDNPAYSPNGKTIYFQSGRSGSQQIWRMDPNGNGQEQGTEDNHNLYHNCFPHPSPDGKWIVFLGVRKTDASAFVLPENDDVFLFLMPTGGGPVQTLAKLLGGQGTLNAPSWSPDSKRLAFVSYQWAYP